MDRVPCLDPPRGAYKRMCRVLRKASSQEGTKVPIYQVQSFAPSKRNEETIQEASKERWRTKRGWRGWRRNNDNPSRCTSISSRRMPHIFADTNDATSRTNTCLVVLRSSVTRSPLLSYLGIPSPFSFFFFLLPPSMNEIIPFL